MDWTWGKGGRKDEAATWGLSNWWLVVPKTKKDWERSSLEWVCVAGRGDQEACFGHVKFEMPICHLTE